MNYWKINKDKYNANRREVYKLKKLGFKNPKELLQENNELKKEISKINNNSLNQVVKGKYLTNDNKIMDLDYDDTNSIETENENNYIYDLNDKELSKIVKKTFKEIQNQYGYDKALKILDFLSTIIDDNLDERETSYKLIEIFESYK